MGGLYVALFFNALSPMFVRGSAISALFMKHGSCAAYA